MDNATNYLKNLDKGLREWTFFVRFTREELEVIQKLAQQPHPYHLDNVLLMEESRRIAESCKFLLSDGKEEGSLHYSTYSLDGEKFLIGMTYNELCSIRGITQNSHPNLRSQVDETAGEIFHRAHRILERARQNAVPEA